MTIINLLINRCAVIAEGFQSLLKIMPFSFQGRSGQPSASAQMAVLAVTSPPEAKGSAARKKRVGEALIGILSL
jgi:hypothetical protein